MEQKLFFFVGKGGVGKSTTSSLSSVFFAKKGYKILLASMDPAHNLVDIFNQKFSEKPKQVIPNLEIIEVDLDFWIKKYLKKSEDHIRSTYNYQNAFSMKNYFKILQFSPGIDVFALMLAFQNILEKYKSKDIIIFDMPPTALTLQLFSLPSITQTWLNQLLIMRNEIRRKKEIISKITIGNVDIEKDKVKTRLEEMIESYQQTKQIINSKTTRINVVKNPEKLSVSETHRIITKLKDIGLEPHSIIINKNFNGNKEKEHRKLFENYHVIKIPQSQGNIQCLDSMMNFLKDKPGLFDSLLD